MRGCPYRRFQKTYMRRHPWELLVSVFFFTKITWHFTQTLIVWQRQLIISRTLMSLVLSGWLVWVKYYYFTSKDLDLLYIENFSIEIYLLLLLFPRCAWCNSANTHTSPSKHRRKKLISISKYSTWENRRLLWCDFYLQRNEMCWRDIQHQWQQEAWCIQTKMVPLEVDGGPSPAHSGMQLPRKCSSILQCSKMNTAHTHSQQRN